MVSALSILEWKYIVGLVFFIVLLMPYSSNKKIRYYGVYTFYVLYVSTFGLLLVPIFLLRPKNIDNLTIAGIIMKYFTKVLGITWYLEKGKDILKEQRGAVIVANHQSVLDVMGMWNIWEIMGRCTAVAKREIMYVAPFGPVAWLAGLVFIDRSNPKKAKEQLKKTAYLVKEKKTKLWLFPEGTRNQKGKELLPFKKGAFITAIECNVPVIPVVFSPYYFIDSNNKIFNRGNMYISALDPIPTDNLTLDDVELLMNKTYNIMQTEYQRLTEKIAPLKISIECR
ncbi:1-acyl-sn-glycerol-3-phosphate acyltransferase beta-like isoform X2 [Cimex lectularius]|nr:1-acyl-sn-glycerol-3-phosphate acyltransferase beta-like isoform X2 [Cimex lectularius]XP_014249075.1 1-acyl-sn-glycerol-3-phosphate acyltransferase beta-like isoform X2 [Cimex lectularius]XP_014249076.1 1-acyl-sn-glycerol-3-phosphate acyltransferase beta-like isoform X2 [Cimex lectularius]XP_014249077.1 1-acyl-sn-glycerol-3-phosphate acyltransferase beta-like isoform X2 [Cimex lectularius]XP_014249078.1 1-acyl-sn-glycerol-3-phosphate acyltransferase beta-like isoform X2 [Cimex lectularius]